MVNLRPLGSASLVHVLICLVSLFASAATNAATDDLAGRAKMIFGTLPETAVNPANPDTIERVILGQWLYFDARLSKNHDISCNSCHQLDRFGVDGQATSPGHRGQRGSRNSPTVLNAALHIAQFWDGRAADVEAQAKGPVLNPIEMAMPNAQAVETVLRSIPGYASAFKVVFPNESSPITFDNMALAIAAFERRLLTPSPFDAYLAGESTALDENQQRGLSLFMSTGCITCHNGVAVGGGMFQKLGLVEPYETADQGRFEVTGKETDRHIFKVPSLRNVEKTGPYFHDGSVGTLADAVRLMAKHQLGKTLSNSEVDSLLAFLGSLTGRLDSRLSTPPELPKSGPTTPKPDPS